MLQVAELALLVINATTQLCGHQILEIQVDVSAAAQIPLL